MCGRYVYGPATHQYWENLHEFLSTLGSRYNVAVTSDVPILKAGREPTIARWGLVPSWAKDTSLGTRCFNARSETAAEKPAFRAAFKRRRCMVFADGYYEWTGPKGDKQPHYIHLPDDRPLLFYGLWESWPGPKGDPLDEPLATCTILTTDAAASVADIHDRMPCLCPPDSETIDLWLDPEFEDRDHLQSLLCPYEGELTADAVSRYVNKVGNEGPQCLEPADGSA